MPVSPSAESTSFVSALILANGQDLPQDYSITSIKINHQITGAAVAEITLMDDIYFTISSSDIFKPDTIIEIQLGYDALYNTVFTGKVSGHTITTTERGTLLKIICKEESATVHNINYPDYSQLKPTYGQDIFEMSLQFDATYAIKNPSRYRGYVRFPGSEKAKVNTTIELGGLGKKFDEEVLISGVEHVVENGNWFTTITVGVEPQIL
jgi:hypothetical protein